MDKKELARKKLIENITKVSGWGIPQGFLDSADRGPNGEIIKLKDPDPAESEGETLQWIYSNRIKGVSAADVFRDEIENYGDGLYLQSRTGNVLNKFARTKAFDTFMLYPSTSRDGSTRWGYRPYVANKLTGGIDDSYHASGEAVDIRVKPGAFTNPPVRAMQNFVIQAVAQGFRGIGFGLEQFHFDTRQGGFVGYVYPTWASSGPRTYKGNLMTPGWVLASALCDMEGERTALPAFRENKDPNGAPLYTVEEIVGPVIRSLGAVPSKDTGRSGSAPVVISDSDIRKYFSQFSNNENASLGDGSKIVPISSIGVVGGITALAALIIGGVYGFRRFLRNRREQAEAQKIAMDQKKRVIISRFRNKNARLIKKAKSDPEIAARLEQELRAEFELFGIDID